MNTTIRRIKSVPGHLRPRRFRLVGVGDGRTGTTTLARKFRRYRSAHEYDHRRMLPLSTQLLEGASITDVVRRELRRRSWRFNLEVDSANFLSPMAGEIADLYRDARFVLLIRDCFSWLDSRIESLPAMEQLPLTKRNFAARYGRHADVPAREEAVLTANGALPIASYLRVWAELPERVLRDVPADRICVVRTEDLDAANDRLAELVGIDPSTIEVVHDNRTLVRTGLLSNVPREFIIERATEFCAPLMEQLWGRDWLALSDRLPHR